MGYNERLMGAPIHIGGVYAWEVPDGERENRRGKKGAISILINILWACHDGNGIQLLYILSTIGEYNWGDPTTYASQNRWRPVEGGRTFVSLRTKTELFRHTEKLPYEIKNSWQLNIKPALSALRKRVSFCQLTATHKFLKVIVSGGKTCYAPMFNIINVIINIIGLPRNSGKFNTGVHLLRTSLSLRASPWLSYAQRGISNAAPLPGAVISLVLLFLLFFGFKREVLKGDGKECDALEQDLQLFHSFPIFPFE